MIKDLYAIFGASGFGREVLPIARNYLKNKNPDSYQLIFIDDAVVLNYDNINNCKVVSYTDFLQIKANNKYVSIAIADGNIRSKLAAKLDKDLINYCWDIQAENVVVMDDVTIGNGSIISPFVTLTSNIKIGSFFHANIYSYVAHDCVIGDFVTFAPCVKCNGNVIIEDGAYIGTGAIIKQGRPGQPLIIGSEAIIGMGAVVTKSVSAGMTVIGNPAKPLSR